MTPPTPPRPSAAASPSGPVAAVDWAAPPRRHVERTVWVGLAAVVASFVVFVAVGVGVLAGAQSYVRAEGFYVKGQLQAAHRICQFAGTGELSHLRDARDALRVPVAYRAFRQHMDRSAVPAARTTIERVGHRPGEARLMAALFPAIRRLPVLAPSLDAWTEADDLTAQLQSLANRTERAVADHGVGSAEARALSDEASSVAYDVAELGVVFTDTLSRGTHLIHWGLIAGALGLGSVLAVLVGVPFVHLLRRLRTSDGRYRQIVRHGSDIVTAVGADGRIVYESPSAESVLGFAPEELVGREALGLVHPDDRPAVGATVAACLADSGAAAPVRFRFARAEGGWVTLEGVAVNHLDDPGIRAVVVSSRDVSERVRAEAEHRARLSAEAARWEAEAAAAQAAEEARRAAEATAAEAAEAQAHAEELLRLKASFLHNMSHELRTPLTAILGFSEILAAEADGDDQELALAIYRGGLRLRSTLNSVLDHAQLEAGRVTVNLERIDVVARVTESVDLLRPLADEKGIVLVGPTGADVWTPADVDALDRVVTNLVGNAVKFTQEGAVSVTVQRVSEEHGDYVEVAVSDTGVGMTDAELSRVFNAFEQASEGESRRHEGTGLGLAITERLVALQGGCISVESTPGVGSTFRALFPAEPQRAADRGAEAAPPATIGH